MFKTIVETSCGKVQGERVGTVSVWRGIPYAKPPIGALRFCPPEWPEPWDGVRDASKFGPIAMQPSSGMLNPLAQKQDISEDCLYLNVWSPDADDKLRPVMVWIHGGAYVSGSGSDGLYDGTSFALNGDVVVVTFNYRLGAFGFLHLGHMGVKKYATSGNCGLLDAIAALKWVNENIRAFGGDPDRITIFGESAGAISVANLLVMPDAKGIFKQAIMESPTALTINSDKAAEAADKFLASLNLQPGEVEKLIEMPAKELLKASTSFPFMTFCPAVDGISIPENPEELLRKGAAKDISIICGSNKDEFNLFTAMDTSSGKWDANEIAGRLERIFGPAWPELSKYYANEKMDKKLYNRIMSYYSFIYPALKYSEILSANAPVWVYKFCLEHAVLGACHSLELPYVWHKIDGQGGIFRINSAAGKTLADQIHHAWIAFAHRGNPNTEKLPHWPKFDLEDRAVMVFNSESKVEKDPYPDREIWDKISMGRAFRNME
jgi:para-nitrobenzyl esterase